MRLRFFQNLHFFDDDGFQRHIIHARATPGAHAGDFVDYVHAFDHFAKDRVAPAILTGMVEKVIVFHVDEKLRRGRMRVAGARHGNRADLVFQTVFRLVANRVAGDFLFQIVREPAALNHETGNDAVKHRAVIKTGAHVFKEVFCAHRRFNVIECQHDAAFRSNHLHPFFRLGGCGQPQTAQRQAKGDEKTAFHTAIPRGFRPWARRAGVLESPGCGRHQKMRRA